MPNKVYVARVGPTGAARCFEFTHHTLGTIEEREVDGARDALAHNLGLGGARLVTLYGQA